MSGPARYSVPRETTRVEIRAGNSRFIATAARASTVDDAKAFIASLRDEMPDATHHVYAYKVGYGASITEGMSDDGEPSGTSGPPVLAVLRGADVGDAVIVVTRYFGGTKLGTGGLVSAYGDAARAVLEALPTEEKVDRIPIRLSVPYTYLETVHKFAAEADAQTLSEDFTDTVDITLSVPSDRLEQFRAQLTEATARRVTETDA